MEEEGGEGKCGKWKGVVGSKERKVEVRGEEEERRGSRREGSGEEQRAGREG